MELDHLQAKEGQQAQHLAVEQFDDPPVQLVYLGDTLQSVMSYSLDIGLNTVPVHEEVDEVDELIHLMHHTRPPDFRTFKNILQVRKLDTFEDRFLLFPFQAQLCNIPVSEPVRPKTTTLDPYRVASILHLSHQPVDKLHLVFHFTRPPDCTAGIFDPHHEVHLK